MAYKDPEYQKHYREKNKDRDAQRNSEYYKIYYEKNKNKIKKKTRKQYEKQKATGAVFTEKRKQQRINDRKTIKSKFFELYGNKCNCPGCNETNKKFLTLDHVNNNRTENGIIKHNDGEYRKANNNYNPEEYQILCYNCNFGKQRNNGTCPHIRLEIKEIKSKASKKSNDKLKNNFFDMYGGKCISCGQIDRWFLTLDHKKNNGKELRKKNGTGLAEYRVAINLYDPETYQILCYNCNCSKGHDLKGGLTWV